MSDQPPDGALVLVVGPSGAGKDTLMEAARAELARDPRIRFARRLITRPAMAGAEDHDSCDDAAFDEAERSGEMALSWQAHGLRYGIPCAELASLFEGGVVVANISRRVIASAENVAPRTVVLNITAPAEVLAARLAARGRETKDDIAARLAREVPLETSRAELVTIVNDGSIAEGAADVVALLTRLAAAK